jgi:hypothetical protein
VSQQPVQLDYSATRRPVLLRRRSIVTALAATAIAAATLWQWDRVQLATDKVRLMLIQRRCLHYTADRGEVVYDERANEAAVLLSRPAYTRMTRRADPESPIAGLVPACWDAFGKPPTYQSNRRDLTPRATLFLHERSTTAGRRRLVVMDLFPLTRYVNGSEELELHTYLFTIGSVSTPPECVRHLTAVLPKLADRDRASKNLVVYAGQPANDDGTRWRIPYHIDGVFGEIEATLVDAPDPAADDQTRVEVSYTVAPSH